jgi:hypothetical protein
MEADLLKKKKKKGTIGKVMLGRCYEIRHLFEEELNKLIKKPSNNQSIDQDRYLGKVMLRR